MRIFLIVFLLLNFSCIKKEKTQNCITSDSIPYISIADSLLHEELLLRIISSDIFSDNYMDRPVLFLFKSNLFTNDSVMGLSMNTYIGSSANDVCGGYFVDIMKKKFLLIISCDCFEKQRIYQTTDSMFNVSPFIGVQEESDEIMYFKYENHSIKKIEVE